MKVIFPKFGATLRKMRDDANVSQVQLCKLLGLKNGQFISNAERGLCALPPKYFGPIAELLDGDSDALIASLLSDEEDRIRDALHKFMQAWRPIEAPRKRGGRKNTQKRFREVIFYANVSGDEFENQVKPMYSSEKDAIMANHYGMQTIPLFGKIEVNHVS